MLRCKRKLYMVIISGDSLSYHKDMPFSTKDADHDEHADPTYSCANAFQAAWWYGACHQSNLNGHYYQRGQHVTYSVGVTWRSWKGHEYSFKAVTMKMRPAGFTPGKIRHIVFLLPGVQWVKNGNFLHSGVSSP